VIVNRTAERLRRDGALLEAIRSSSAGATLYETRTLAELEAAIAELHARGAERVVFAGGDGTYMAGVTALHAKFGPAMPQIALAPGGTVSTVARNWGMKGDLVAYTREILRAALDPRGPVTPRQTLRVASDDRADLGFIFGAGLVASFFDAYYASPHKGYAGAARIVARIFAGAPFGGETARRVLTPTPCELLVDDRAQRPSAWSLVAASVVRDLGLKMRVTYRAGERDDALHVVASALGPAKLGPQMPLVLLGRRLLGEDHVDDLARSMELRFPDRGTYVLDGERIATGRVRVTLGPPIAVVRTC
jgi:diacylglycerol kinase family enzyme